MEKKVTKKEMFRELLTIGEVADNSTLVEFINHELELLEKKASSSSKKVNELGDKIKTAILEVLNNNSEPMAIADIQAQSPELAELSNQKVSAYLTQLKKANVITRVEIKKKAYFTIAE